ncbi:hypothetical protein Mp_2g16860 [Marchantia polymorpha subsp. ruderalis]|uniref:Uncharacterized protein n=1 Tax=Marchantia polymorpha TaxID=3197 RepID=A0A2R6WCL6_MARPO|nr:hypothetical protein MARPO_0109s0027 [Marchantia polymorpha]BBN02638.1 hypothetical protein Mp_2g16860 [Marchantia polymorpha subsp. ruderalis]|eukprot:PTQ31596.1 hypothetical protein MARPO_0109s0027 [Marchantia polymorpha]
MSGRRSSDGEGFSESGDLRGGERQLSLQMRHLLLQHGDGAHAPVHGILHSRIGLVRQRVDAVLAVRRRQLVQHLGHIGHPEHLVHVSELLRLIRRKVWRKQTLRCALPPKHPARRARGRPRRRRHRHSQPSVGMHGSHSAPSRSPSPSIFSLLPGSKLSPSRPPLPSPHDLRRCSSSTRTTRASVDFAQISLCQLAGLERAGWPRGERGGGIRRFRVLFYRRDLSTAGSGGEQFHALAEQEQERERARARANDGDLLAPGRESESQSASAGPSRATGNVRDHEALRHRCAPDPSRRPQEMGRSPGVIVCEL